MKKVTVLYVLIILNLLLAALKPVMAQTTEPIAAYAFSEGTGTLVADASGHQNTGTLMGGARWTDAEKYGKAISFDGSSGYISIPDSPSLSIGAAGTMEAWVNLSTINRWNGILAKGSRSSAEAMNYSIAITTDNTVECIVGNGSAATIIDSASTLTDGVFYHVACTWNKTTISIYIDGVWDSSIPQNLAPARNSAPLYIGQFASDVNRTSGIIAGVRIYNRALRRHEIRIDMKTPVYAPQTITVVPGNVRFDSVPVGFFNTQTMTLSNSGISDVLITKIGVDGATFAWSGLNLPLTIAIGRSVPFTVSFTPTTIGSATGSLSLTTNTQTQPLTIELSGTGIAPFLQLSAVPTSLSFGNVALGSSGTRIAALINTGNFDVRIDSLIVRGTEFSTSELALPITLSPGQAADLSVIFAPIVSGDRLGSIEIQSTSSTTIAISVGGSGIQPVDHSVTLSWTPSTSTVVGNNVYRGTNSGGPYNKLNVIPVDGTTYSDNVLQSGATYYYVVTAVDFSGIESDYSNEASTTLH
ncbi:MAG TPA: LamG-like jellyroll fold domain-containing protein [Candidatus Dormibacteraeota bacterium]|nr:LamG-like jellyroll fold domain-containing protein [Candidatus Dormibacteraeota bacterium]